MVRRALDMPLSILRFGGLLCIIVGFIIVWLVRDNKLATQQH